MGDENAQPRAVSVSVPIAEPAPAVAVTAAEGLRARGGKGQDGRLREAGAGDMAAEAETLFQRGLLERVHMMGGRLTLYRPIMPKGPPMDGHPGEAASTDGLARRAMAVPQSILGPLMTGPVLAMQAAGTADRQRASPGYRISSGDLAAGLVSPLLSAVGEQKEMKAETKTKTKTKTKKEGEGGQKGKRRKRVDEPKLSLPATALVRRSTVPTPSPAQIMARGVYSVQPIATDMCYVCGGLALDRESYRRWVFCTVCAESFHIECAQGAPRPDHPIREGWTPGSHIEWHWQCPDCRVCSVCRVPGRERPVLCCRLCHRSVCTVCDPLPEPRDGDRPWGDRGAEYYHQCSNCQGPTRCLNCLSPLPPRMEGEGGDRGRDQGSDSKNVGPNSGADLLCPTCVKQSACPRCWVRYAADDYSQAMVGCSGCDSWLHAPCLGLTEEEYRVLGTSRKPYYCHACRKQRGGSNKMRKGRGRVAGDGASMATLDPINPTCYICRVADDQIMPVHGQVNLVSPLPVPTSFVHPSCAGNIGSGSGAVINCHDPPPPPPPALPPSSPWWFRRGSLSIRMAIDDTPYPEMTIRKNVPRRFNSKEGRPPLGETEWPVLVMRLGLSLHWRPRSLRELSSSPGADHGQPSLPVHKLHRLLRQWADRTSTELPLNTISGATAESFLRTALCPEIIACFKLLWARGKPSLSLPILSVNETPSGMQNGSLMDHPTAVVTRVLTPAPPRLDGAARMRVYQRSVGGKMHVFLASPASLTSPSSLSLLLSAPSPWSNKNRTVALSSLRVGKSAIAGWGLFTMQPLAAGARIIEYVGEQVGQMVADRREALYSLLPLHRHDCYLFRLDGDRILDATRRGNLARFINHSCAPNCESRVEGRASRIVIYARQTINPGEELTYDYKLSREGVDDRVPCHCGASDCRGYMN